MGLADVIDCMQDKLRPVALVRWDDVLLTQYPNVEPLQYARELRVLSGIGLGKINDVALGLDMVSCLCAAGFQSLSIPFP